MVRVNVLGVVTIKVGFCYRMVVYVFKDKVIIIPVMEIFVLPAERSYCDPKQAHQSIVG